jgi:hypothetical protein
MSPKVALRVEGQIHEYGSAFCGKSEKLGIWEKARQGAVYRLDDTILMNSRNRAAQEVTCIGLLYVTVADATAQKEVEFKVKQTADGKIIVSVNPFLF